MLTSNNRCKCEQLKCPLFFSNWKSLANHLRTKHNDIEENVVTPAKHNQLMKHNTNEDRSELDIVEGDDEHKDNIDGVKKVLFQSALRFVTKLNSERYTNNVLVEPILKDLNENLNSALYQKSYSSRKS